MPTQCKPLSRISRVPGPQGSGRVRRGRDHVERRTTTASPSPRKDCAPLAGKSTLNRLEHAPPSGEPGRYHRIGHDADALQAVLLESFIDSWKGGRPSRLVDIDATDDEVHGRQEGRFFHG